MIKKNNDNKCFKLFSNCISINGYSRSVICDLQMQKYFFIPNFLHKIFISNNNIISNKIKEILPPDIINFLLNKNVIFETDEPSLFPNINQNFQIPSFITNAIIEVPHNYNPEKLIKSLNRLNCIAIQLHFGKEFLLTEIRNFLSYFSDIRFITIECFVFWNDNDYNLNNLVSLYSDFSFSRYIIYNAPQYIKEKNNDSLIFHFQDFSNHVKEIFPLDFIVNTKLFTESQKHNTYFNRKLYIGKNGEIKNASECKEIYGNIKDIKNEDDLKTIIGKTEFQKYWFAHKEIIDICKDCEFRHLCVDSRVPIQRENGTWFHHTECQYNPYIAKWQGEENFVSASECGTYDNEKGFVLNKQKVKKLNKQIWGE